MYSVCKNIFAFSSLEDVSTIFIDKTNRSDLTKKETFWLFAILADVFHPLTGVKENFILGVAGFLVD